MFVGVRSNGMRRDAKQFKLSHRSQNMFRGRGVLRCLSIRESTYWHIRKTNAYLGVQTSLSQGRLKPQMVELSASGIYTVILDHDS